MERIKVMGAKGMALVYGRVKWDVGIDEIQTEGVKVLKGAAHHNAC